MGQRYQRFGYQRRPYGGGRGGGGLGFGRGLHRPSAGPWARPTFQNGFNDNVHFRHHAGGANNRNNNNQQHRRANQNSHVAQPGQQVNVQNRQRSANKMATNQQRPIRGGGYFQNNNQNQRGAIQQQKSVNSIRYQPGQNMRGPVGRGGPGRGGPSRGGPGGKAPIGGSKGSSAQKRKRASNASEALKALRAALLSDIENFKEKKEDKDEKTEKATDKKPSFLEQAFDRLNSDVVPGAPPQNAQPVPTANAVVPAAASADTSSNVTSGMSYRILLKNLQDEIKQDVENQDKFNSKNDYDSNFHSAIGQIVASAAKWKDANQNRQWKLQLYASIVHLTNAICKVSLGLKKK